MYTTEKTKERSMLERDVALDEASQRKVKQLRSDLEDTKRWQNMETHRMSGITAQGAEAPAFITNDTAVRSMQGVLGVKEDGIWGPKTETAFRTRLAAHRAASEKEIERIYREAAEKQAAQSAAAQPKGFNAASAASAGLMGALAGSAAGNRASITQDEFARRVTEYYEEAQRKAAQKQSARLSAAAQAAPKTESAARRTGRPKQLYGSMPMKIEGTEGLAVPKSGEELVRRLENRAARAKAAYDAYGPDYANPRSKEGREKALKKAELYQDWQEAERRKDAALEAWYLSPEYDTLQTTWINSAVQDAEKVMQQKGYNSANYPQNRFICMFDGGFPSENQMLTYTGSLLNRFTKESGQEHMCNLYMVEKADGTVEYAAGPVYTGVVNNVIEPYMKDAFGKRGAKALKKQYPDAEIEYMGMLHSHPNDREGDNDNFSWGDSLVSAVSGRIYLTTPHGNVYALDREDGVGLVVPGMVRDGVVIADRLLDKYGLLMDIMYPQIELLDDYYVPWHDETASGRNFETFPVKTYDSRKP